MELLLLTVSVLMVPSYRNKGGRHAARLMECGKTLCVTQARLAAACVGGVVCVPLIRTKQPVVKVYFQ